MWLTSIPLRIHNCKLAPEGPAVLAQAYVVGRVAPDMCASSQPRSCKSTCHVARRRPSINFHRGYSAVAVEMVRHLDPAFEHATVLDYTQRTTSRIKQELARTWSFASTRQGTRPRKALAALNDPGYWIGRSFSYLPDLYSQHGGFVVARAVKSQKRVGCRSALTRVQYHHRAHRYRPSDREQAPLSHGSATPRHR